METKPRPHFAKGVGWTQPVPPLPLPLALPPPSRAHWRERRFQAPTTPRPHRPPPRPPILLPTAEQPFSKRRARRDASWVRTRHPAPARPRTRPAVTCSACLRPWGFCSWGCATKTAYLPPLYASLAPPRQHSSPAHAGGSGLAHAAQPAADGRAPGASAERHRGRGANEKRISWRSTPEKKRQAPGAQSGPGTWELGTTRERRRRAQAQPVPAPRHSPVRGKGDRSRPGRRWQRYWHAYAPPRAARSRCRGRTPAHGMRAAGGDMEWPRARLPLFLQCVCSSQTPQGTSAPTCDM